METIIYKRYGKSQPSRKSKPVFTVEITLLIYINKGKKNSYKIMKKCMVKGRKQLSCGYGIHLEGNEKGIRGQQVFCPGTRSSMLCHVQTITRGSITHSVETFQEGCKNDFLQVIKVKKTFVVFSKGRATADALIKERPLT